MSRQFDPSRIRRDIDRGNVAAALAALDEARQRARTAKRIDDLQAIRALVNEAGERARSAHDEATAERVLDDVEQNIAFVRRATSGATTTPVGGAPVRRTPTGRLDLTDLAAEQEGGTASAAPEPPEAVAASGDAGVPDVEEPEAADEPAAADAPDGATSRSLLPAVSFFVVALIVLLIVVAR